jgi:hypothetical protein
MSKQNLILVFAFYVFFGAGNSFCQNSEAINKYGNYLTGLSPSDFKNVTRAIEYYEKNISSLSPDERDYGYVEFRKFYDRVDSVFGVVLGTGDPNYTPKEKIYSKSVDPKYENDKDVIKFKKTLSENGFDISAGSEPGYYVMEVPGFMIAKFGKYITPAVSEYLRLREINLQTPAYYDIYIWISADEMANRLKDWDKFLSDYPNSPFIDKAKFEMNRYFNDFLGVLLPFVDRNPNGESNMMVFDMSGNMLESGKSLYQRLIGECGDSYLGNLLREYYAVLKKTGFKRNSKTIEFLKGKGFEVYDEN